MKIKPLMLLPPLVFIGLGALFYTGMQRDDPDQLPTALAGQPAPPVVLTPMEGLAPFDDATLRDGQVKLVNFWASWCAPCRVEHPNLLALGLEGIPIYGVNYKDKAPAALAFLAELGDPYTAVGADAEGRMALNWGLYGVPETYVIDGDGQVVTRFAGPITERVLESTIRPAIEKARR
ncbi:DsbE family thiol:disulfide interchange protein [Pseudooceanicola sp. 200-1SW]|uniref:DsbE family thiol:disulfide interchange protein n=1 Tax=Pseudooceanicola sp. 200-1SW TaxID=3425949 RepID=UPI003D7F6557